VAKSTKIVAIGLEHDQNRYPFLPIMKGGKPLLFAYLTGLLTC